MQSKLASFLEAAANTAIGVVIAFAAQYVLFWAYNIPVTHAQNAWIVLWMTVLSFVRSYVVRRMWNAQFWTAGLFIKVRDYVLDVLSMIGHVCITASEARSGIFSDYYTAIETNILIPKGKICECRLPEGSWFRVKSITGNDLLTEAVASPGSHNHVSMKLLWDNGPLQGESYRLVCVGRDSGSDQFFYLYVVEKE